MAESDFETARLSVHLAAIAGNYRSLKQLAGGAVTAAVVKADAYGLGAARVAPALAADCDTFFIARLAEGIALRQMLPRARIFLLDGATAQAVPAILSHNLIPVLNSLAEIAAWKAGAAGAEAAIQIDSGMNRLGLPPDELAILAAEWKSRLAGLTPVLLMSHLACADDPAHPSNPAQLSRFRAALAMLPPMPASLAASSGIFLGRDYMFDLVRPGLALYGGNPHPGSANPMQNVVFWGGRVLQTRRIDKGEAVGYGATFRAKRPSMLATVALGYADGIPRALSNRGAAFIAGVRVPVVGRVSMDLVSLDITDAGPVRPGDMAEFLGRHITLEDFAHSAGTNAYEVLTSLGHRLPRHYPESAL